MSEKKDGFPLERDTGLDRVLDDAGAGIFFLDDQGRFIRTNATMCNRLLYEPGDLENRYALELLDRAQATELKKILDEMLALKRMAARRRIRYRRRDGSFFWGDVSLSLIQNNRKDFQTIIGIVIDINEQKKAEERLQESEEKYRRMFDKSGVASIIIEPDMTITMANEEFEKLTGYNRREIEHRLKWSAFIAPEDLKRMTVFHHQRRRPGGRAPEEYECRIINRDNEPRDIFIKVGMLPDNRRSIASFMDITSLKKTTHALQESRARLLAIIEAAAGLIYTCSRDFTIEFMNKALVDKLGRDMTGHSCYRVLYGRDSRCPWCGWETVFRGDFARFEFESPLDQRWYDLTMSPISEDSGEIVGMEAFLIDITERKIAEKELRERESYLHKENVRLKSSIRERYRFGDIIGKSPVMQQVYELILNAAATEANVIIHGESGTGKELVARAVHDMSERGPNAFVTVNCGAIPENLLESEFFGYKKGAFSGASRDKHGYLDLADGGTLFLDELGEIGLSMQVKLLRVIEGLGYMPVGGNRLHQPDVRIIAATNRDLTGLVRSGRMREDFFYRIHVIPIHLPPLRERREDIPLLIDHFMRQYQDRKQPKPVPGHILDAAMIYDWPGNVRELQNVLHRYLTLDRFELPSAPMKEETTATADRPREIGEITDPAGGLPQAMAEYERKLILQALEKNHWRRDRTSSELGIHRRTLLKKINKHKLDHSHDENDRSQ